jgi:uncharacterized protein
LDLHSLVKVVEGKVLEIYLSNKGNYPSSHDFLHVKRVLNNALMIADVMGLSEHDKLLLTLACLLHDISIPIFGVKEDHAVKSAEYAKAMLLDLGLESTDIEIVCNAIRVHSWSSGLTSMDTVSMILQDADRLDALGVVGFSRMIIYGEFAGRVMYFEPEIIPRFRDIDDAHYTIDHVFSKLIHIPAHMNTDVGRRIALDRLKTLLWLIKILSLEIKGLS